MNEIEIEDKEKLVKVMWEALANHEFSAWSWSAKPEDVYDIDFGCAIREVAEKFGFQKNRRLHYNKRTKRYYFT